MPTSIFPVSIEKFGDVLAKVIENALDPNTDPTATRTVTLTMKVKPTKERTTVRIEVSCASKMAPDVSFGTMAHIGKHGQEYLAFENNPRHVNMDLFVDANRENVETLTPAAPAEEGSVS